MSRKQILRIAADLLMTALLLLLMSYSLLGEAAHEWLGVAICALFVLHHILNRKWLSSLRRGRYTPLRIFQTALVLLVFLCMLGSMVSGIALSRHVFRLGIRRFSSIFRTIHMISAYWGFVLMSLHLGLHWNGMMAMARKHLPKSSAARTWMLRVAALLLAGYGVYAFVRRDFGNYMLLRYHFVFFDFNEPLARFLLDYAAILGLFVWIGHYAAVGLQALGRKKANGGRPDSPSAHR